MSLSKEEIQSNEREASGGGVPRRIVLIRSPIEERAVTVAAAAMLLSDSTGPIIGPRLRIPPRRSVRNPKIDNFYLERAKERRDRRAAKRAENQRRGDEGKKQR